MEVKRLAELKNEKYLIFKVFEALSENMHYELFKYLNSQELLQIRVLKLGGYLLTSNPLLRSRIKNYFQDLSPRLSQNYTENVHKLHCLFGQIGLNKLSLRQRNIRNIPLKKLLSSFPEINIIDLGISY